MGAAAPGRPAPAPRAPGLDWLFPVALAALVAVLVRIVWFTPIEAMQGPAQKIFYVHVPAAVIALYVATPVLAITSAVYLWLKEPRLDRMAESAAEVGAVFMAVVLITGPLWGKPVWGTWWTWDARLTLTLFTFFVFLGYLVMRGAVEDPGQRGRFSAVLGILAAILVPFIHLSVYLFRTLHPQPIVLKPDKPSLPDEMRLTLLLAFGAFFLLFVALIRTRYRWAIDRDLLAERQLGAEG